MFKLIRHLFLLAIQGDTRPLNFFPWYSCPKNGVILVKNITNSGCWIDQYCISLASAGNIGLGLWPRPILLLQPTNYKIGVLTIYYLYNVFYSKWMFFRWWVPFMFCDREFCHDNQCSSLITQSDVDLITVPFLPIFEQSAVGGPSCQEQKRAWQ